MVSARDMALISREATKNSMFRKIVGTVRHEIPPTNKHADPTPLNNHHQMISAYKGRQNLYEYCIGGKTGWTSDAGNTLVTFAEKRWYDTDLCSHELHGRRSVCWIREHCLTIVLKTSNFIMWHRTRHAMRIQINRKTRCSRNGMPLQKWKMTHRSSFRQLLIFWDTQTDVNYDQAGGSILGTLVYSYGGRQVGTANVVTTGAKVAEYPFEKKSGTIQKSESAKENDTSVVADSSDKTKSDAAKNDIGKKKKSFYQQK